MAGATRTLVVWCPDWPVVVAGAGVGGPLAVVDGGRVVACSPTARARDVRRGLRRREAEARCPGLAVVAADPAAEARAFEPVVAAVEAAFTPRVEIVRPGVCAFATRGPSRYFGGDEALAAKVAAQVDDVAAATLGEGAAAPCRVGVADGRFAAEQAARRGDLVPPGGSAAYLAPLPATLAAGPDLGDLLARLGVHTLGDLAALPSRAVLARFGPDGMVAARLARGFEERPVAARTAPPDLAVAAELDPPADRLDAITFVARSLAASLAEALVTRGLAADLVRIEAETDHGESLSRAWRVGTGASALAERVRWQLDGWLGGADRPSGPVTLLRLVPEEVRPEGSSQAGFWGGDRAAAERIGRVLARVQGRLGHAAVATAVVTGGRSPAEQVRLVPWGDPRPAPAAGDAAPWPGSLPLPAPATVLDAPLPAMVLDASGAPVGVSGRGMASAPPATVSVANGPRADVVAWAGPWLVDERWWDASAHRRRARWQIVTASGAAHLLCLEGGRWVVEAVYD
ncbi:MAG: DNA polymerase Y family protein [Acidimicrobiia bacterium]